MIQIHPATDARTVADARALIAAHFRAHSTRHDESGAAPILDALPAPYLPPLGGLWVAREGDEALGCIALQPLEPGVAEVKRMYVRPESRGRGVARLLATHAIDVARAMGHRRLRLGTLTTMDAAQALYTGLGFRPIPAYRPVEFGDTVFYELALEDGAGF